MNSTIEQVQDLLSEAEEERSIDIGTFLNSIDQEQSRALEAWVHEELDRMPAPISSDVQQDLNRRSHTLKRILAEFEVRRGKPERLVDLKRTNWFVGGSALPLVKLLLRLGRCDDAYAYARVALAASNCQNRSEIEALVREAGRPPTGWTEAVCTLARHPTVKGWDELMQFTPPNAVYHRIRNTIQALMRLGVDLSLVFRFATRVGITPDAVELVESGQVEPEMILDRADEGSFQARGLWLGLAAQAALARGDRFGAVRLLREAYDQATEPFTPDISTMTIRDCADGELNEMLDKAGIPGGNV